VTHLLDGERRWLSAVRSRPVLARPELLLSGRRDEVDGLRDRARRVLAHRVDAAGSDLHHTVARLRSLSPLTTMQRGYAVVQRAADDAVLRDPADAAPGAALRVRLAGGELAATVTDSPEPSPR
jgi:exodeoxyribonuclease VII large subunit